MTDAALLVFLVYNTTLALAAVLLASIGAVSWWLGLPAATVAAGLAEVLWRELTA